MHLLHAMSLAGGQSIGNIQIYEKYFPLPFDKYIVFAPFSKDAKNYSLYPDVLSIISPILNKHKIKIVQIGANGEMPFKDVYYLGGQTNINQAAFIIKNSLLFFGADSFGQHIAGHYNIPLVDLIVNNYADVVKPYFGNRDKQIILEPPRDKDEKPSFAFQEMPKTINKIHPEEVASSILKLLNLEYNWPYKQLYLGEIYISPMIISVADSIINPQQFGVDSLIMDLTVNHNEQILLQQLNICHCSIITSKPLSEDIFKFHKATGRIRDIVYQIETDHSSDFVKKVIQSGIRIRMISPLEQQEINKLKLEYMELGVILKKNIFEIKNIKELEDKDLNNLFFRSGKFYIGRQKLYPSRKHYSDDKNINSFDEVTQVIDNQEFWSEIDSFRILEKIV